MRPTSSRVPTAFGAAALLAGGLTLGTFSCNRTSEPTASKPAATSTAATVEKPVPEVRRIPAPARIAAIGDLHGDLAATRAALRLAGAIKDSDAWSGGDLMVVQVGDQIDRGDDDRAVLDLFDRLADQAKAAGGSVISLMGNHELMNVAQRFDYVTPGGFQSFLGAPGANPNDPRVASDPEPARARAAAFLPGAPYARMLSKRPVAVVVGDTVFVHGGLLPKHVRYGVERINHEVAAWMDGQSPQLPRIDESEDSPTWQRRYSAAPDAQDCQVLGETLDLLRAKRMVMGHTVQRGGISSACDERAWRIDVGLSAVYGGRPEVLVIEAGKVSVKGAP